MTNQRLIIGLVVIIILLFAIYQFVPGLKNRFSTTGITPTPTISLNQSLTPLPSSPTSNTQTSQYAAINTKYGQIVVKLYSDVAPNTVKNFVSKSDSGFYNNLTFHRVEPGFVVQGGDPLGNGTGGGTIASEINNVPFKRASVGLARGMDIKVSNDSQFFICLTTEQCSGLTGGYVNFGEVVSGMNFVDQIVVGDKINSITTKTK